MTQRELKALYREELKKSGETPQMEKSTDYVVEHNGELYGIRLPAICTDFRFGYSMDGTTMEEACNMALYARSSSDYFINKNLEQINGNIEELQKVSEDMKGDSPPKHNIITYPHHHTQTPPCSLCRKG